jgi:iron complex outermembrane receptor protein
VRAFQFTSILTLLALSTPATAQKAGESATSAADDAFGNSVGNERVGLYSPDSARGFSPSVAGNLRIDGLYIDRPGDFSQRLMSGSNIRVGFTAQGYPFAAPTGIADFSLRRAGSEPAISASAEFGPYSASRISADAQLPLLPTLSLSAGADFVREDLPSGTNSTSQSFAIAPRWQPREGIDIVPFYGQIRWNGWTPPPIYFPAGDFLPSEVTRHKSPKQDWAGEDGVAVNYGIHSSAKFGPWLVQAGLFNAFIDTKGSFIELARNVDQDGLADRQIVAMPGRRTSSISGEVRLSRQLDEDRRRHTLILNLRGRDRYRKYGGEVLVPLGHLPIDEQISIPEPDIDYGPQSHDRVRQFQFGVGYDLRWRGIGQLSVGAQKATYRKEADRPGEKLPTSRSNPWLFNAAINLEASKSLVFYGSYSTGLEESAVAPAVASNAGFAPPAILTKQFDAGLRYVVSPNVRLVAGVFQIEKPYYGLDSARLFTNLGTIRNRGIELSLAGTVAQGLTIVAGTVFLNATLSGEAVEQGLVGKRPIGSVRRTSFANIEYLVPGLEGLTAILSYSGRGKTVANRMNTLTIEPAHSFTVGARYRFQMMGKPTSLFARLANATDEYSYTVAGEGLIYSPGRRFIATLTTDF